MGSFSFQHIAIIMDGNGRWAERHALNPIVGHQSGVNVAQDIVKHASRLGISYLTLYTFSFENWKRDALWVEEFLDLLRWYLTEDIQELIDGNIRIRVIGHIAFFPDDVRTLIRCVEEKTAQSTGMTVVLALSYGGRDELVRCVQKMIRAGLKEEDITEDVIVDYLDTRDIPNPDLLIRTGSEKRLSNFLLWQVAYTELYFSEKLWPEFTTLDFDEALCDFKKRSRRYGLREKTSLHA